MCLPAHHIFRPLAEEIALYYLDRAERGLNQRERLPSPPTAQRDYSRVMCVTGLVVMGLTVIGIIGAIVHKNLF